MLPWELYDKDVMAIGIDMSLDQIVIERSIYTILDVLSDVGGLKVMIVAIFAFIKSIINYNGLDSTIIEQLYTFPDEQDAKVTGGHQQNNDTSETATHVTYKTSMLGNFADYILDMLPGFCRFCKKTRRQRQYEAAIECLRQETDVIKLIREIRFIKSALSGYTQLTS